MKLVLMGGGKYAGVFCDMFAADHDIIGYFDDVSPEGYIKDVYGIKYLGGSNDAAAYLHECPNALIGIGSEGDLKARIEYFAKFKTLGFAFPAFVHPSAHVAGKSSIGEGTVVQYRALIHPCVTIGRNCVISSSAIIGHDSVLGDNVYVGPGVIINGSAVIGDNTFLGTGSIVIQKKTVGKNCVVAAASCIVSDIPDGVKVKGVPGKF